MKVERFDLLFDFHLTLIKPPLHMLCQARDGKKMYEKTRNFMLLYRMMTNHKGRCIELTCYGIEQNHNVFLMVFSHGPIPQID